MALLLQIELDLLNQLIFLVIFLYQQVQALLHVLQALLILRVLHC